jgi:protein-histidine N-methyltransferase
MTSSFSFGFSGEDIDMDVEADAPVPVSHAAETGTLRRSSTAFPVQGQPLLPSLVHSLASLLEELPEKIAYSTLKVALDDGEVVMLPRRELWDVRLQLMAQDDDVGLGGDDVKTGVYEGGFKSWESSVDLVRVLSGRVLQTGGVGKVLEVSHVILWYSYLLVTFLLFSSKQVFMGV